MGNELNCGRTPMQTQDYVELQEILSDKGDGGEIFAWKQPIRT